MTPQEALEQLKKASGDMDQERVAEICREVAAEVQDADEPFPPKVARSMLMTLRGKRYFAEMAQLGSSFVFGGQRDAKVRRLYAQGLIDSGQLPMALDFLKAVADDPDTSKGEVAEAWGLIGRVHKQLFVNGQGATSEKKQQRLEAAISAYDRVFDKDPEGSLWHGINVVALLARAQRDGITIGNDKDFKKVATNIRDVIDEREEDGAANIWDYATAMEASVALDDAATAIEWAEKYVRVGLTGPADEFEFGATLRQLREVWGATPDDFIGQSITPLLEAAMTDRSLNSEGGSGSVSLNSASVSQLASPENFDRLEKVFGKDAYKQVTWLQILFDRLQAIGLVVTRTGKGSGTGFVVNGRSIAPGLDDDWYFLTNSHVVTNDDEVHAAAPASRKPLRPEQAFVTFQLLYEEEPRQFAVKELIWTSPPHELDATLLRLDPPFYDGKVEPFPISVDLAEVEARPRIYIAGHPGGQSLTVSLHDNHLLEFDDRFMRYRTPTDPGSSGSPVFNDEWELVGLHHAGDSKMTGLEESGEAHEANEGIRLKAIMKAVRGFLEEPA